VRKPQELELGPRRSRVFTGGVPCTRARNLNTKGERTSHLSAEGADLSTTQRADELGPSHEPPIAQWRAAHVASACGCGSTRSLPLAPPRPCSQPPAPLSAPSRASVELMATRAFMRPRILSKEKRCSGYLVFIARLGAVHGTLSYAPATPPFGKPCCSSEPCCTCCTSAYEYCSLSHKSHSDVPYDLLREV
jgi:hypothetical protein